MIADFEISNSGDLVFKQQESSSNSLKVNFALSKTKAMKFVFDLSEFEQIESSNNAMKIRFAINKKTANKTVNIIKDQDALVQLLKLKLKNTLGELPLRTEFGSKIGSLKHKEINKTNLNKIESYVQECISDIVFNPVVKATPYINYNNGYTQTVLISVYSNSNKLLEYTMER